MHAYIIHGYGASPTDHWFPWLQARLQAEGIPTTVPPMPDSEHPNVVAWQETLAATIGTPKRDTLLIAHSLGTISLLHYLSAIRPAAVGGIVLVAGFGARLPELPSIGGFNIDAYIDRIRLDDAILRHFAPHMHHLISDNDYVVAPANSRALAARIGGTVHELARHGHFLSADGITELPVAWDALQTCLNGENHV
jgi:hypothetical protein